jgi:hypothetical protein
MWEHPNLPVPIVEDPGCFEIVVVGSAAGRGAYFYGAGEPVTSPSRIEPTRLQEPA